MEEIDEFLDEIEIMILTQIADGDINKQHFLDELKNIRNAFEQKNEYFDKKELLFDSTDLDFRVRYYISENILFPKKNRSNYHLDLEIEFGDNKYDPRIQYYQKILKKIEVLSIDDQITLIETIKDELRSNKIKYQPLEQLIASEKYRIILELFRTKTNGFLEFFTRKNSKMKKRVLDDLDSDDRLYIAKVLLKNFSIVVENGNLDLAQKIVEYLNDNSSLNVTSEKFWKEIILPMEMMKEEYREPKKSIHPKEKMTLEQLIARISEEETNENSEENKEKDVDELIRDNTSEQEERAYRRDYYRRNVQYVKTYGETLKLVRKEMQLTKDLNHRYNRKDISPEEILQILEEIGILEKEESRIAEKADIEMEEYTRKEKIELERKKEEAKRKEEEAKRKEEEAKRKEKEKIRLYYESRNEAIESIKAFKRKLTDMRKELTDMRQEKNRFKKRLRALQEDIEKRKSEEEEINEEELKELEEFEEIFNTMIEEINEKAKKIEEILKVYEKIKSMEPREAVEVLKGEDIGIMGFGANTEECDNAEKEINNMIEQKEEGKTNENE